MHGSSFRLKILLLSHSFYPDIGGIESISEMLATEFVNAGHEVRLLTWSQSKEVKLFPYPVIRQPGKIALFREYAWADVVFENNPCLRMAWAGVFFKRKSVTAIQTWISNMEGGVGLPELVKFMFLRRACSVIACSRAIQQRYFKRAFIIGNPYKEGVFKILPGIQRNMDFVFLGRLVSDKGADVLIQAFNRLLTESGPDGSLPSNITLTIIGSGPEYGFLKNLVTEFGLNDNVLFTGALTGAPLVECLNRHRFIVVPSRWEEPFGIVVLEGMACGCVPIVSNCGGLPDATGNAGLLFKQADTDALFLCMRKILASAELERKLRGEALQHLEAHRSVEVSARYLSVFAQSLSNTG